MEETSTNQPASVRSLLGSYFQFLRMPNLTKAPRNLGIRRTLSQVLRLYSPHLLATLLIGLVIGQVVTKGDNILFEDIFSKQSVWSVLFLVAVLAPIAEEIIFRLPLRPAVLSISIPASIAIIYLLGFFNAGSAIISVVLFSLLGLNIYFAARRLKSSLINQLYVRFSRLIFYLLAILFGAIHISNYDSRVWILMPLLVLPQCVLGLLLGFVRIQYGLGWAMLIHAFHNGCLMAPLLIVLALGSPELRSQFGQDSDFEALSLLDKLLMGGLGVYFLVGFVLCLITSWKVIREWRRDAKSYEEST